MGGWVLRMTWGLENNSYCREVMEDYSHWFSHFLEEDFKTKLILSELGNNYHYYSEGHGRTNQTWNYHVPIWRRNLETVFRGMFMWSMYNVQCTMYIIDRNWELWVQMLQCKNFEKSVNSCLGGSCFEKLLRNCIWNLIMVIVMSGAKP